MKSAIYILSLMACYSVYAETPVVDASTKEIAAKQVEEKRIAAKKIRAEARVEAKTANPAAAKKALAKATAANAEDAIQAQVAYARELTIIARIRLNAHDDEAAYELADEADKVLAELSEVADELGDEELRKTIYERYAALHELMYRDYEKAKEYRKEAFKLKANIKEEINAE